ncbi:TPA: hypothetical protein ACXEZB_004388 [Escherichia coli]
MEYIKTFRKAGEPTAAAPLYLCQEARSNLANWLHYETAEQMHTELNQEIQENDRFEYLAIDDAGKLRAMMVIYPHYDPHWGDHLFTRFSFSAEPGALSGGYRWMKDIAKLLKYKGYLITRQVSDSRIISDYKRLRNDK